MFITACLPGIIKSSSLAIGENNREARWSSSYMQRTHVEVHKQSLATDWIICNVVHCSPVFQLIVIFLFHLSLAVFQIKEGSQANNTRKPATWPDKINACSKLEKVWARRHTSMDFSKLLFDTLLVIVIRNTGLGRLC